jgi:hypothetical protein
MKSRINKILTEIEQKVKELKVEYSKLMENYKFSFLNWKIIFDKDKKASDKLKKRSFWYSITHTNLREFLSIPFIYAMFLSAILLDISLFIYQQTAMRLYWIPLVKREYYISFDRKELAYLNWVQKFNCLYCSYMNWLFSYAVEIGWRTEKYWCPIKHAKKIKWWHDRERCFADYWDVDWFKETAYSVKEFYENDKK